MYKKIYGKLSPLLWKIGTMRTTYNDLILLTGSPRSGTTWIFELLRASLKSSRLIWEPLISIPHLPGEEDMSARLNKIKNANYGLGLRPYINPAETNNEFKEYFNSILFGNYDLPIGARMGPYRNTKLEILKGIAAFRFNTTILKFCRAQRLLPWVNQNFPIKSVLIIRNPLAVIASQIYHHRFQFDGIFKEHPIISDSLKRDYPDLADYANNLKSREEKLAATWCFDYLIPLKHWDKCDNSLMVSYENLVLNPQQELLNIEEHFDIKFTKQTYENIKKPSTTTVKDSNVKKGENPLDTWKHRLTTDQVNNILGVADNFGIKIDSNNSNLEFKIRAKTT